MKIGIVTFWTANDNYGQSLQCYALQKYLRDAGHNAYLIRYKEKKSKPYIISKYYFNIIIKLFNPYNLIKYIKYKIDNYIIRKGNKTRNFDSFRNKYINLSKEIYYHYEQLKENPPEADIYIAGSDQIWNPSLYYSIEKESRAYFLDFGGTSIKRISYAASFCKNNFDNEYIKIITPLLKNFDYITVREETGLNICKQCGIDNVELVPDPTILLNPDEYRLLYKNEPIKKIPNKPYCFFYYLDNNNDFSIHDLHKWAKYKNLEIIYIPVNSQNDKYKKYYATIPEWIYLLEHADYVITNSYHCVIFSLLFNRNFAVIPLSNKNIEMNTRFDTLFKSFNISERYINNSDYSILDIDINWIHISEVFQSLTKKCKLLNLCK